jgi:hypothetical protein
MDAGLLTSNLRLFSVTVPVGNGEAGSLKLA